MKTFRKGVTLTFQWYKAERFIISQFFYRMESKAFFSWKTCSLISMMLVTLRLTLTLVLFSPAIGGGTRNFWYQSWYQVCKYFVNIFWIFCEYYANILKIFCKYFVNILQIFWTYFDNILTIFWQYFDNIW